MTAAPGVSTEDRFSVTDLINKFYHLIDTGRAGETAPIFAADATLEFGPGSPKPGTIRGGEISVAMRDRERMTDVTTRHVVSNIALQSDGDRRLSAHYLLTLFRADARPRTTVPAFVADVDETWVRGEDEWKISGRLITPIFSRQVA
jgi:hypothetical protein